MPATVYSRSSRLASAQKGEPVLPQKAFLCAERDVPAGRPTDYTPEIVKAAWEYAAGGWAVAGDKVPSVAGLACEIGIHRDTCYAWSEDEDKEFSDILKVIAQNQERQLINNGLDGTFNPPITKMMLSKHGYSDKVENNHTSSDGSMSPKPNIDLSNAPDEVLEWIVSQADERASED